MDLTDFCCIHEAVCISPQSTLEHIHHPRKKPRACQPPSSASYVPPSPKQPLVYFCVHGFAKHGGVCSNSVLHPLDHCWVLIHWHIRSVQSASSQASLVSSQETQNNPSPGREAWKLKTSGGGGGGSALGRGWVPTASPYRGATLCCPRSSSHPSYLCFFPIDCTSFFQDPGKLL